MINDGYHTFDELYEHRNLLFCAFASTTPQRAWYSRCHADGTMFDGYIIVGLEKPHKHITYHMAERFIPYLAACSIKEIPYAPEWDGHTPDDVLERLRNYLLGFDMQPSEA